MEQEVLSWLSSDNGLVVHQTIFFLLLLGGFGFPIPEDIPIILGGVAAAKGIVSPTHVFLTCYLGVVTADQAIYFIGYKFGKRLLKAGTKSPFFPAFTEEKVNELREGLRKKRLFYIFIGRHLFPVRSVTFLTAGALHIPYWEFLISDAIAALISVSIVLTIGYYLGEHVTPEIVSHLVHEAHFYILGLAIILGMYYGAKFYFCARRKKANASEETT